MGSGSSKPSVTVARPAPGYAKGYPPKEAARDDKKAGNVTQLDGHAPGRAEADAAAANPNKTSGIVTKFGGHPKSLDDLKSLENATGSLSAYTVLHGGHIVEDLKFLIDSGPLISGSTNNGNFFVVPKDPIIRLNLAKEPTGNKMISAGHYDLSVDGLKKLLQVTEFDRLLIFGPNGELLRNSVLLRAHDCFGRYSTLVGRPQLDEYFKFDHRNERLSSVLKQARDLQENWCATLCSGDTQSDMKGEISHQISAFLKAMKHSQPAPLKLSSYDRFLDDFPQAESPEPLSSDTLEKLKDSFSRLAGRNSKCPEDAKQAAGRVMDTLLKKNKKIADDIAKCLTHLLSPITKLSSKQPLLHAHTEYKNKITDAEDALNRYRDIRAGKMFDSPEECHKKMDEIQTMQNEMEKIADHFIGMHSKWESALRWSDLSEFECVEADYLHPAIEEASAFFKSAATRVEEENTKLESFRRVRSDAEYYHSLLQKQVVWCKDVVQSAQKRTERDIEDIDQRIHAIMTERAAKELLRASMQQRLESLDVLAAAETDSFEVFKTRYEAKEAILSEHLEQAKLGEKVFKEFQDSLAKLQSAIINEIQELRRKAYELRLDVAADCVSAYKVAHSVQYILRHYETETFVFDKKELDGLSHSLQLAMICLRSDLVNKLGAQVDHSKCAMKSSEAKIRSCEDAMATLEEQVAAPWAFVCKHAEGWELIPHQTTRVVLRTSNDNRAAWGGEDRVLERPYEWNQEMQAEAEAYKSRLRQGLGDSSDIPCSSRCQAA